MGIEWYTMAYIYIDRMILKYLISVVSCIGITLYRTLLYISFQEPQLLFMAEWQILTGP